MSRVGQGRVRHTEPGTEVGAGAYAELWPFSSRVRIMPAGYSLRMRQEPSDVDQIIQISWAMRW